MKLDEIIKTLQREKYATDAGTRIHAALRHVVLGNAETSQGDPELIAHIQSNDMLRRLFDADAMTEVPVAGYINHRFVSRRIDRMRVFPQDKRVIFIDYKSDIDPRLLRDKYARQLGEYATLLQDIYPDYAISGYVLWLHDWTVEHIVDAGVKNLESGAPFGL